jgi:hypothetical protein
MAIHNRFFGTSCSSRKDAFFVRGEQTAMSRTPWKHDATREEIFIILSNHSRRRLLVDRFVSPFREVSPERLMRIKADQLDSFRLRSRYRRGYGSCEDFFSEMDGKMFSAIWLLQRTTLLFCNQDTLSWNVLKSDANVYLRNRRLMPIRVISYSAKLSLVNEVIRHFSLYSNNVIFHTAFADAHKFKWL